MRKIIIILGLFFLTGSCRALDFPLMRLTKDGHSILLIGSMHIGIMDPSRTKEINALLKETGSICMEDDPGDIPGAQRVAQAVFGNPPGQRLRDRLGDALYDQSKNQLQWYLAKGGAIDDISPYAVASLLTMNMPAMRDFTLRLTPQQSLDAAIRSAAVAHGQQLLTIESSDAVPAAFARLTEDEWRYYVAGTLKILHCPECAASYSENMIHAYDATTDAEAAQRRAQQAMASDPRLLAIFEKLFYGERNIAMVNNIEHDALAHQKCSVVAIGAGHLGGPLGVVARLRERGVKVEKLTSVDEAQRGHD
ncbi:TraB/GumN family protein [Duganella sp. FT27W]|uniref:TraB/GumN family protein n=1 Tax=Duganella sp. FT27W TaxID=2654636 RepID=UPI00128D07B7|nr:TraB/GumN family protein [Duganella sp. FT27W]MPQ57058.1 hypothetical protein [Duganella sp. FT27W]